MTLTPHSYPAYKPSGVPWLDDVPEHWEVRRLKSCVDINKAVLPEATEPDFEFPYLEIGAVGTGLLASQPTTIRFGNAPSRARRIVRTGDTIVSTVRTYLKATWFAGEVKDDLICSTGFAVFTPRNEVYPKFLSYIAQSNAFSDSVTASSVGTAYPAIPESRLGSFHVPLPPLPEQAAIVRYLDYVDRRIRRYVAAKRKLIALLEEEKQAIVNRAVTRGLDPNVRLKPSGVEWLGDVPEHWEVRRLKTICGMKSGEGITAESIEAAGEYPVYGGNGLRGYASSYTHDGAFALIGRQGALCGNVHITRGQFWASEHAAVAALDVGHEINWFGAILTAMNLNQYSIAAAQPGLAVERILNLYLPVPHPQEQKDIANHIEGATADIDAAIARARRQMELVQEYRTRLIADVVTGKLDVREVAAHLPDEDNDQDLIGESGPLANGLPGDLYSIDESVEDLVMEEEVTA